MKTCSCFMNGKTWFLFLLLSVMLLVNTATAKNVKIAIGLVIPPYVIRQNNSGIEVDIIKEAFKAKGYAVTFLYVPNLRISYMLKVGLVDGTVQNASYNAATEVGKVLYETDTIINYHNFAITFENYTIATIDDLADKRVIAFVNAKKYLGPVYKAMTDKNKTYYEKSEQNLHVVMLYNNRVDVVISDKRIFMYWRNQARNNGTLSSKDMELPLKFNPIFSKAPRDCKFLDKGNRDNFNDGLKIILDNGVYDAIIKKYQDL
ncbi:MAG: transporter substrate-binding domain-containing protein [Desulfobacteraceae bacterium]|nr:transporter substrate-binding domain-containing protein [Desulfobacteraceae bacterium]